MNPFSASSSLLDLIPSTPINLNGWERKVIAEEEHSVHTRLYGEGSGFDSHAVASLQPIRDGLHCNRAVRNAQIVLCADRVVIIAVYRQASPAGDRQIVLCEYGGVRRRVRVRIGIRLRI